MSQQGGKKANSTVMVRILILCLLSAATAAFVPPNQERRVSCSAAWMAKKEATFGMGCFWKPAEELLKADGVIDTVAGYTGYPDAPKAPKYDDVCFGRNWVEGVRVYYDDNKISYTELLDAFFEAQEPKLGSRQYASLIFPHDNEQEENANEWLQTNSAKVRNDGVVAAMTKVEPLSPFFKAEGYHQRYWQKQRPRFAALIGLIVVSSGALDSIIPATSTTQFHTGINVMFLGIAALQLLERQLDAKVEKL